MILYSAIQVPVDVQRAVIADGPISCGQDPTQIVVDRLQSKIIECGYDPLHFKFLAAHTGNVPDYTTSILLSGCSSTDDTSSDSGSSHYSTSASLSPRGFSTTGSSGWISIGSTRYATTSLAGTKDASFHYSSEMSPNLGGIKGTMPMAFNSWNCDVTGVQESLAYPCYDTFCVDWTGKTLGQEIEQNIDVDAIIQSVFAQADGALPHCASGSHEITATQGWLF